MVGARAPAAKVTKGIRVEAETAELEMKSRGRHAAAPLLLLAATGCSDLPRRR